MPQIYSRSRRVVQRRVNPIVLATPMVPEPTKAAPSVVDETPGPSTDMTLAELKALAEDAGLPTYGTKADIVERLTDG